MSDLEFSIQDSSDSISFELSESSQTIDFELNETQQTIDFELNETQQTIDFNLTDDSTSLAFELNDPSHWGATEPYREDTISGTLLANVVFHGYATIPDYFLSNQTGLTSITFPSDVRKICTRSFNGCTGLTEITVPTTVDVVESYAFYGCSGLENVELGCATLGDGTTGLSFRNCTSLEKVWIRENCTTILGNSVSKAPFYNCPTTLTIYLEADSIPSGFSAYWNRCGSSGGNVATVVLGQKTKPW